MALIPGMNYQLKNRSVNARLVVSGAEQPAEAFILDPSLPVCVKYPFGWPGITEVVIPRGLAVAVGPAQIDFETGKKKPVLTIANGSNPYVGIAPYNICKKYDDQMGGNEPTFIRNVYIELPYIPKADDCALVKYGAAYGDLKEGDIVTVSKDPANKGHLTKWVENSDSIAQIVGQVIAIEAEQEPWGWFKWVMWDETAKQEDKPEPPWSQNAIPTDKGYPYEPAYRDGTLDTDYYLNPYMLNPKGIKGLTDGSARSTTLWSDTFTVPAGAEAESTVIVNLGYKNVVPGSVGVSINGVAVAADRLTIDYKNGSVAIRLPQSYAVATNGDVTYKSYMYGTPPGWDYVGAVGVVRILLKD